MPALGEIFAVAMVAGVVTALVSGVVRAISPRGRDSVLGAALLDGALLASAVGVVLATMSPIEQLWAPSATSPEINLVPLDRLDGAPPRFAVINTLLLVPTVVLLAQRWRRAGIVRLTLAALLVSLTIETVQLFHPMRGTNIDDLALNTVGAFGGAIVGVMLRSLGRVRRRRRGPARAPLEAEVAADARRPAERTG